MAAQEYKDPELQALETKRLKAEIGRYNAEAAFFRQSAAKREHENWALTIARHEHECSADNIREFSFFGQVDKGSTAGCMHTISQWAREDAEKPITLIFNSPGGLVTHGLALYDRIVEIRDHGTPINTVGLGMAASMGGVLLQAGEKRSMGKHAYLMIHEVSAGAIGNTSEMEDELKLTKRFQERLLDILADRASVSKTHIKRNWKRKDWWLDATEALELGFIDEIRS